MVLPMDIKDIFQEFIDTMSMLSIHQKTVRQITQKEYKDYQEFIEALSKLEEKEKSSLDGLYGLHFHNLISQKKYERVDFKRVTPEDYKKTISIRKNKQYQWLLAEGYEAYEKFIIKVYAYVGHQKPNSWPLIDFGNTTWDDLPTKTFQFFETQANKKKDTPNGMLNHLRHILPNFKDLEKDNFLNVDYKFKIILLQFVRHIIVHNHGEVFDYDNFKKRVFEKAGCYNNGNPPTAFDDLINSLIFESEGKHSVFLLERYPEHYQLPGQYQDVYMILIGFLISHAHLVKHCTQEYLKTQ